MKKVRYQFNSSSLRYEKVQFTLLQIFWRALGLAVTLCVFASIVLVLGYTYVDSPKDKVLRREITELTLRYELLSKDLDEITSMAEELRHRDDNIYRVIFEAEPIPQSVRNAGAGGANLYERFKEFDNGELIADITKKAEDLKRKLYIQSKSYDELYKAAVNKEKMFASIPAIQPISNKDLTRMASGFGYRIDPIYKTVKFHEGNDFTSPRGTPVYATGDGIVQKAKYNTGGYGNTVVIDHGYGYKSQYAHLSRFAVFQGQKVNRGQIIGYVGSTGKSTAPHLHYEVLKNGIKINPINFMYNDLSPSQYNKLLELANTNNQSFD